MLIICFWMFYVVSHCVEIYINDFDKYLDLIEKNDLNVDLRSFINCCSRDLNSAEL